MPVAESLIVVLGAAGQVGRALVEILGERAVALDRSRADLADPDGAVASLREILETDSTPGAISAVINAAAFTQVDRAETERELAMTVNGVAPGALARACADAGVPFVHYSTDYVFPGTGTRAWTEDDPVAPLNFYGESKLAGERAVIDAGGRALVLRTSWVYDATGRNFLTTMLRLGAERPQLAVVADQHGAPTYAPHLAGATLAALERFVPNDDVPGGVYHLCGDGETTWHGFAAEIFAAARRRGDAIVVETIEAITSEEYPVPAKRPSNSRLNTNKARRILGVQLPDWRDGLADCMRSHEDH